MRFILGFSIVDLLPTILVYSILSALAIGVIVLFKKKSEKELKALEEKSSQEENNI